MRILKHFKKWWLRNIHGVGKKVYWENHVDPWFTGEYVITTKREMKLHNTNGEPVVEGLVKMKAKWKNEHLKSQ